MIVAIRQGLKEEGVDEPAVPLVRCASAHGVLRPTKKAAVVQERFAVPIKQMIEENPSFGYRTVAYLLRFNKNTVQRIFQLKHWQVRKRPVGFRPRVRAILSVAAVPNECWAPDLCRIVAGMAVRCSHSSAIVVAGSCALAYLS